MPDVPHLADVVALELAGHRAQVEGREQVVRLRCDPYVLPGALGAGRRPELVVAGDYEVRLPAG